MRFKDTRKGLRRNLRAGLEGVRGVRAVVVCFRQDAHALLILDVAWLALTSLFSLEVRQTEQLSKDTLCRSRRYKSMGEGGVEEDRGVSTREWSGRGRVVVAACGRLRDLISSSSSSPKTICCNTCTAGRFSMVWRGGVKQECGGTSSTLKTPPDDCHSS